MAKWIEWIPDTETGVFQQLLATAGKHSGVIWIVEPPPTMRLSCTPVQMDAVKHYMEEGGLPVGWVDLTGTVHSFVLQPPFEPPDFKLQMDDGSVLPYGFHLRKDFLNDLYNHICIQNTHLHQSNNA